MLYNDPRSPPHPDPKYPQSFHIEGLSTAQSRSWKEGKESVILSSKLGAL